MTDTCYRGRAGTALASSSAMTTPRKLRCRAVDATGRACGHTWTPGSTRPLGRELPAICPRCRSRRWRLGLTVEQAQAAGARAATIVREARRAQRLRKSNATGAQSGGKKATGKKASAKRTGRRTATKRP